MRMRGPVRAGQQHYKLPYLSYLSTSIGARAASSGPFYSVAIRYKHISTAQMDCMGKGDATATAVMPEADEIDNALNHPPTIMT